MTVDDNPDPLVPGPRHEAPTGWVGIPPLTPVDARLAATPDDIADLRQWNLALGARIDTITQVAYTAFGIALVILLAVLILGYFTHRQAERADDLDAARVADTTQQATISTQQHTALCDVGTTLASIPRASWPGGVSAYDQAVRTIQRDATTLRCGD